MTDKILQNLPSEFDPEIIKQLLKDRKAMIAASRHRFFYFFIFYFGLHLKYAIAPFHFKMFRIAQDEKTKRAVVMSFRNSGKTTILNTAYTLWAVMGALKKKHVVIASQTQQRAKDHLMNIRKEIEDNKFLRENLGPFSVGEDRWGATTLIIPAYGARISAISIEEGIRGLKEGPNRPDLIIADDIEDSNSVKTRENRDKTFDWFTGELIPLGESDVKVVVLGNFLNKDSVLSRLEEKITKDEMSGIFLRVPLVDENNEIAWTEKFPLMKEIEELRRSIGNERTWQRDFLLHAIPGGSQIVSPEWIKHYDVIPNNIEEDYQYTGIGVDLAISEKESADCTAMVAARVYGEGESLRIYILPQLINERLSSLDAIEKAKWLFKSVQHGETKIYAEDVAYQRSFVEHLTNQGYPAKGVTIGGQSKYARLNFVSFLLQSKKVFFPNQGAERLIEQLINFGNERYDDLADAFSILLMKVIESNNEEKPKMTILSFGSGFSKGLSYNPLSKRRVF